MIAPSRVLALVGLASWLLVELVAGLRGGAPTLACASLRPFHGLHRAKPASASQFFVTQSSLSYAPDESVTVEIATHSNERFFRGFLVQAYDPANGLQIGKFLADDASQPLACSAATHRNHEDKRSVTLKWAESHPDAPRNGTVGLRKQVRFRASIVVLYSEFYTGFESSERNFAKWAASSHLNESAALW